MELEIVDRIIQMAWEDRTPFEAIENQFGLKEKDVIVLIRTNMQRKSFEMWRKRMKGKITKHSKLMSETAFRFKSGLQREISLNKISKRK